MPAHFIGYPVGGFFQFIVVVQLQLHSAHLVGMPLVQTVHQAQVCKQEQVVVFGKVGLVNADDCQAAGTHIVLYVVGVYLVAEFQLQFVGYRL